MLKTIIGVLVMLIPFLLLYRFKDKKVGFAYILGFFLLFHLLLAVGLQTFGWFNYWVVMFVLVIVDIFILASLNYKKLGESLKKVKIDWVFIFVLSIIFISLFSVHYNYTGDATTVNTGYKPVKNMKYSYPYFSDEWVASSLIQYTIKFGKLPLVNSLWYDQPYTNLEFPFHSFASQIVLILDINPVSQYALLPLFSGILICVLVYFILRACKIRKLISGLGSLFTLYIVNGANLPGIWTFIPIIMGIISLLIGIFFMQVKRDKMVLLLCFLTLVFYPPLAVIHFPMLFVYFLKDKKWGKIAIYCLIVILAAIFVAIFAYFNKSSSNLFGFIFGKFFYPTFSKNAIPNFSIFNIIPIPVLFLAVYGIVRKFKEKSWLIAGIIVGVFYWWLYSFILWRIIIEYARVIVVTSILLVIMAGVGLATLIKDLKTFEYFKEKKILEILLVVLLILFFVFSFFYTQRETWKDLKLYSIYTDQTMRPASLANNYLQEDDLFLFQGIEEKRFLSHHWKGLAIGSATHNYPLHSKESTLTNAIVKYNDFRNEDCEGKQELAKKHYIEYVYTYKFNCSGFEELGFSEENFYLYEVKV